MGRQRERTGRQTNGRRGTSMRERGSPPLEWKDSKGKREWGRGETERERERAEENCKKQ